MSHDPLEPWRPWWKSPLDAIVLLLLVYTIIAMLAVFALLVRWLIGES